MTGQELYTLSFRIAEKAHKGQFRHDGITNYIDHPIELASHFKEWEDKAIAILHDAIEDGESNGVDGDYIRKELYRIDPDGKHQSVFTYIMGGVETLTHRRLETYMDYIRRVSASQYKVFKIMDIFINLSDTPTERQKKKYIKAMKILLQEHTSRVIFES